jgi:hypothetical protein
MESPKVASLGAGLGQPRLLPPLPANHPLFLDLDTSNCPWNTDRLVFNILSCHPAASLWRVSSSDLSQNISLTKNDHAPQLSRASAPTCPNPAVASDISFDCRSPDSAPTTRILVVLANAVRMRAWSLSRSGWRVRSCRSFDHHRPKYPSASSDAESSLLVIWNFSRTSDTTSWLPSSHLQVLLAP